MTIEEKEQFTIGHVLFFLPHLFRFLLAICYNNIDDKCMLYLVLLGDITLGADQDTHDSGVTVATAGVQRCISVLAMSTFFREKPENIENIFE